MPKPAFLVMDTLDDRREVHHLLDLLSPTERLAFLDWCCNQVKGKNKINPVPSLRRMGPRVQEAMRHEDYAERLTVEIFFDFWNLANTYGLDVVKATAELERRVKAKR